MRQDRDKRLVYWDSNPNSGRTESFRMKGEYFCSQFGWEFEYVPKSIQRYPEEVMEAWSAGEGPDVIDVWPVWLPVLISSGNLGKLDPYVQEWNRLEDYDPAHRRLSRSRDGHTWFLACDLFIQGTHYRSDLMKSKGLEAPIALDERGEWDLSAFRRYAEALHRPDKWLSGVSLRGGQGGHLTALNLMASALGGRMYGENGRSRLDDPAAVEILSLYGQLAHPQSVAQPTAPTDGYLEFAWHFYEGRAGLLMHNDDAIKAAQGRFLGPDRYGACGLPRGDKPSWQALSGFGAGVRGGTPRSGMAARYVIFFVENYLLPMEQLGQPIEPPLDCRPMRPWSEDVDALRKPFRAVVDEDRFIELPTTDAAFARFWNGAAQKDISLLFQGLKPAEDIASDWATAFTRAFRGS